MLRVALVLRSTDVHPVYFDLSTDEHATGVPPYPSAPRGEAAVFFFFVFLFFLFVPLFVLSLRQGWCGGAPR